MSRQNPSNVVRFKPRQTPPPPKRRPKVPKGPLAIGLVFLVLAAIWMVSQHGEKAGLAPEVVSTVRNIGRNISPRLSPPPDNSQLIRQADFSCRVQKVNDGDTLRCADGTRVRLHAISARETDETCSPGHPCPDATAAASTAALRRLVQGRTLECQTTGQSYERVTAICWTPDQTEVNCAMVSGGNAALWPRFHQEFPICQATPDAL